ncbi:hypothetical protein BL02_79 [Klebsiella phage BL02]|nr:hypothetical protein BL02_79 [Klebsiella phage BL02]WKC55329.1 hypothetical protein R21_162 [Klebsiella phage R2_1]CAK6606918.1 unknown function [Klebsiella phage vB_Ko_K41P2]
MVRFPVQVTGGATKQGKALREAGGTESDSVGCRCKSYPCHQIRVRSAMPLNGSEYATFLTEKALLVSGNRFPGMRGEVKKLPAH